MGIVNLVCSIALIIALFASSSEGTIPPSPGCLNNFGKAASALGSVLVRSSSLVINNRLADQSMVVYDFVILAFGACLNPDGPNATLPVSRRVQRLCFASEQRKTCHLCGLGHMQG